MKLRELLEKLEQEIVEDPRILNADVQGTCRACAEYNVTHIWVNFDRSIVSFDDQDYA